jgi:hypothetical protein
MTLPGIEQANLAVQNHRLNDWLARVEKVRLAAERAAAHDPASEVDMRFNFHTSPGTAISVYPSDESAYGVLLEHRKGLYRVENGLAHTAENPFLGGLALRATVTNRDAAYEEIDGWNHPASTFDVRTTLIISNDRHSSNHGALILPGSDIDPAKTKMTVASHPADPRQ